MTARSLAGCLARFPASCPAPAASTVLSIILHALFSFYRFSRHDPFLVLSLLSQFCPFFRHIPSLEVLTLLPSYSFSPFLLQIASPFVLLPPTFHCPRRYPRHGRHSPSPMSPDGGAEPRQFRRRQAHHYRRRQPATGRSLPAARNQGRRGIYLNKLLNNNR